MLEINTKRLRYEHFTLFLGIVIAHFVIYSESLRLNEKINYKADKNHLQ